MGMSRWVHLEDCNIIAETDAAFLVEWDEQQEWLPKSQIADADSLEVGDEGVTVSITEWIAKQKGIDA